MTVYGLSAIAALSNAAPGWVDKILPHVTPETLVGGTLLFGVINSLANARIGKHVSDGPLLTKRFQEIENEDLEKCSFDALLKSLTLVVKYLPGYKKAQQEEYIPKRQQIEDKATAIENYLQEVLRDLGEGNLDLSKYIINPAVGSDVFQAIQAGGKIGDAALPKNLAGTLTDFAITIFPESFRKGAYFDWIEEMLRDGFNWNGKQTSWFDLYCHALVANLKPDNKEQKPPYCARAHAFLQGKGLATILLQQEEQTLKLDQLIKWTTNREKEFNQLREWLEVLARPKPKQPVVAKLEESYKQERDTHYRRRWIPMLGREDALNQLSEFLNHPDPFRWWAITGPGGMGKSRLALDLCLQHGRMHNDVPPVWKAGFVQASQIDGDWSFDWAHWEPDRPHLLVIDYVAGRVETVRQLISDLNQQSLPHKTRLLVLERG